MNLVLFFITFSWSPFIDPISYLLKQVCKFSSFLLDSTRWISFGIFQREILRAGRATYITLSVCGDMRTVTAFHVFLCIRPMEVSCEDEKLKSKIIALFVIEDDKRFSCFSLIVRILSKCIYVFEKEEIMVADC